MSRTATVTFACGVNALEHANTFACEAFGKAGTFTVEVLRSSDGTLLMSIESPVWNFHFKLASPAALGELAGFLRSYVRRTEFAELVIGSFCGASVVIVKDDEFDDRVILRALCDGALVYFKMVGSATEDFVSAVAQAAEELAVVS